MAKRVIVLERESAARWTVLYWLDVPAARRSSYPQGLTSAWSGASTGEKSAIANGAVREVVETYSAEGSPTLAAVQAALEARWQALQSETTAYNPWIRYGSTWDGTSWTLSGVS